MKISNIIFQLRYRHGKQISKEEENMLHNTFGEDDIFDGFFITTKKNIINATSSHEECLILQDGKITKNIPKINSNFYGVFDGLNHRKVLVFPRRDIR